METMVAPVETTITPRFIMIIATREEIVLQKMICEVKNGKWCRGSFKDPVGRRCTLGLIELFG